MRDIFEIAKSGLFTAQKSTAVTSHNIANANTPGYTRQRAELSAAVLKKNGFVLGQGVTLDKIQRLRNDLTDQQIMLKEQELGDLNEQARIYQQIESVLISNSGDDLDAALGDFFNAFSELSNNPQDMNLRNNVISKAQVLTTKFQNTSGDLENIRQQVFDSAQSRVDKVNSILSNLSDVNADIAQAAIQGKPDLNGQDQQMELLKELSGLVSVDASFNSDGTVEARIGGIVVLSGQEASRITAESGPDSGAFRLRLDNGKLIEPGKGALAADIHMFEEGLPALQQDLDRIAESIVGEINAIHSGGYGLDDSINRNFFNASGTTAATMAINSEITANPGHIAASSEPGEPGNNDNALLIQDLRNASVLDGKKLSTSIIELMSQPGTRLNELEKNIEFKESARQMLVNQQASESGVNIDEELSNLIKFQNAYQASARVLNVGQQMYDTLLGIL